ncbi:hypothetical protein FRC12_001151 [Ceratobasidium sp. 428]|nr:hypothetical protein FRC12_001151 [Ceratobasidium sp. 428]
MPADSIQSDSDLDKNILLREENLQRTPDNHPDKSRQLYDLAMLLQRRYQISGIVDDIDQAILFQQQVASLIHSGSPDESRLLCSLGNAYYIRFQGLGDMSNLDSAIELQNRGVALTPNYHLDRPNRLGDLGMAHNTRFQRLGLFSDLQTAYLCQSQASSSTPDYHPNKHHQLGNLGVVHLSQYQDSKYGHSIDEAIACQERALLLAPEGHPEKPVHLENLGLSYLSRFQHAEKLSDLDMAIDFQNKAISLPSDRHIGKPTRLLNLGNSYFTRFQRSGELSDLQSAISCQTRAMSLTADGHPDKPLQFDSLGLSYYHQFRRLEQQIDIDLAVDFQLQSVSLTPQPHPARPQRIGNLGNSYYARYQQLGELSDLDSALSYQTEAVSLTPDDHADRPDRLIDLGLSYYSRFQRSSSLSDLQIATNCHSQATPIVFDEHSNKEDRLSRLADLRRSIYLGLGRPQDLVKTLDDRGKLRLNNRRLLPAQWYVHNPVVTMKIDMYSIMLQSLVEVILCLVKQGCANMTKQLDLDSCSSFPISSGGFGDIYQGKIQGGAQVAIKTMRLREVNLDQQNQKSLKHAAYELYAWSKFQHRNVQRLLGLVEFRGQIGMLSTWEVNGNLPTYLEKHPEANRCELSTQISDGLSYLHGSNVVHGDLKGCNVLVSQDGIPLLTDFGNATIQKHTLRFTDTSTKTAMSLRWAAPELLAGTTTFNEPSDIYALGMETMTGDVPYSGKTEMAVIPAVLLQKELPERPHQYIPSNSEHGETLWSLLKRCWAYEPRDRPSASQVKDMMQGVTQKGLNMVGRHGSMS